MSTRPRSLLPIWLLGLSALVLLTLGQVAIGSTGRSTWAEALQAVGGVLGWGDPLPGADQAIHELRLWRALCASLAGAALAISGVYLQGLFRNPLAAPGVLGVSAGATLGATLAILLVGGYGPELLLEGTRSWTPYALSFCSFLGAVATVALVLSIARGPGRSDAATLILVGVAVNATLGGIFVAIQALVLDDWAVAQAMLAWNFGTLRDREPYHVGMILVGLIPALLVIPRAAFALDLFAGGDTDARRLGVSTRSMRWMVVAVASGATACAVSAVGAIGFIGLVVPHITRSLVGSGHARLLPASALLGALLLPTLDLLQLGLMGRAVLPPGALTALLGGPFFLFILLTQTRERSW
jgi:iron complex transport system permease protein